MPRRVLIVRLSALGDIVHAVPVLAALRQASADIEVDWLVEEAYAPVLALVGELRQVVVVRARREAPAPQMPQMPQMHRCGDEKRAVRFAAGPAGYLKAVAHLRRQRYDLALDLQGLIKSAVWARASGAQRVIGFAAGHLREPQAAWLYHERVSPPHPAHVIRKNLAVVSHLFGGTPAVEVPLNVEVSASLADALSRVAGNERYAVLNPGAAWPNKRWPADRFGALAAALRARHGLLSLVTWGPSERELAERIVAASNGAARLSPPTTVADLAAVMQRAALVVSGDTGPLHIAAAVGAPVVGLYGPTWPQRNGPWAPEDEVISRAETCRCHHKRRCLIGAPCIESITLDEVTEAADRRLARAGRAS